MAFAAVGNLGSTTEKTSDTSIALTVSATAEVGNLVVVHVGMDNLGTTETETSQLSINDSTGANTWVKVAEMTGTSGAAADGVVGAVFASVLSASLASASATITVTSTSAVTAKVIGAHEFTTDAAEIAVEDYNATGQHGGTSDEYESTLSGLTSQEYLLIHAGFSEGFAFYNTQPDQGSGDYTIIYNNIQTTGGSAASNIATCSSYRIATLTTDTITNSYNSARDRCDIYAAIYEVDADPDVDVTLPAAGILNLTASQPALNTSDSVTQPAAGILNLTAAQPAVTVGDTVTQPAAGILALTAVEPAITRSGTVTQPAAGILALTAAQPALDIGARIEQPAAGILTLTAVEPAITRSGTVTQPASGILTLTASQPAVNVSDTVTQPAAGILALTASQPAVNVSDTVTQTAAGTLVLTASQPTVTRSGTVTQPAAGIILLTATEPSISITEGLSVTIPVGVILLTATPPTLTGAEQGDTYLFTFNPLIFLKTKEEQVPIIRRKGRP